MPNKQSAMKHLRASKRKRERNVRIKSAVRTAVKKAEEAIQNNNLEEAKSRFIEAVKKLDKAAQKGVIKKGKADRKKSRLAKELNRIQAA